MALKLLCLHRIHINPVINRDKDGLEVVLVEVGDDIFEPRATLSRSIFVLLTLAIIRLSNDITADQYGIED